MAYTPSRPIGGRQGTLTVVFFGYRTFALRRLAFWPVGSCRSFSPISHSELCFKSKRRYGVGAYSLRRYGVGAYSLRRRGIRPKQPNRHSPKNFLQNPNELRPTQTPATLSDHDDKPMQVPCAPTPQPKQLLGVPCLLDAQVPEGQSAV